MYSFFSKNAKANTFNKNFVFTFLIFRIYEYVFYDFYIRIFDMRYLRIRFGAILYSFSRKSVNENTFFTKNVFEFSKISIYEYVYIRICIPFFKNHQLRIHTKYKRAAKSPSTALIYFHPDVIYIFTLPNEIPSTICFDRNA